MPLVENLARKFSTSDQASGVLSINDLIQCGSEGLTKAIDKIDWEVLGTSNDQEKTLKSFISKRVKGAIRRRIDINRGDIRIPEHKLNEIRKNPKDKAAVRMFFNSIFLFFIILPIANLIGTLCTTFTQFPDEFWGGNIENSEPVAGLKLSTIPLQLTLG